MKRKTKQLLLGLFLGLWMGSVGWGVGVTDVASGRTLTVPTVVSLGQTVQQTSRVQTFVLKRLSPVSDYSDYSSLYFTVNGAFVMPVQFNVVFEDRNGSLWMPKDSLLIQGRTTMFQVSMTPADWRIVSGVGSVIDMKSIASIQLRSVVPVGMALPLSIDVGDFIFGDLFSSTPALTPQSGPDTVAPTIANLKVDGRTLLQNEYVGLAPVVTAQLTDTGSGVGTWNVQVINVGTQAVAAQFSGNGSGTTAPLSISYTVDPVLPAGRYSFKVTARDVQGNTSTANSAEGVVQDGLTLDRVLNSPNPFDPNHETTQIDYLLSKIADVDIYIYALSGELQKHFHNDAGQPGGSVGYNRQTWDGRNEFNEVVANGVYVTYVVAKSGGDVRKGKVKLWVRK